jgi:hypothetical protein
MTIVDPLETAAEATDWIDFVEQIRATIPFPDSTTADPNIVWADIGHGPPTPYGGSVGPPTIPDIEFSAPWEGMLGDTAVDEQTGITVPLDLEGAPVSPAFQDPISGVWTVNPAYTAWAVSQLVATTKPSLASVPAPDPQIIFHGGGATPAWADVNAWASDTAKAENGPLQTSSTVTGEQVQRAVDVGIGTTIKALSGYISGLTEMVAWLSRATRARIDAVQLALFNVASNLNTRLVRVEQTVGLILKLAIPSLQYQITQEKHNRQVDINRQVEALRLDTKTNVYEPLNTDIQLNQITATQQAQAVHDGVPGQVMALAPALLAPAFAAIAALGTRVGALEAESEACVKPMCLVMGPNTDLGKLLKALKVAEWLALLAELASLRADGLEGLLSEVEGWAKTAVGDFESVFFTGGKTLGETIRSVV